MPFWQSWRAQFPHHDAQQPPGSSHQRPPRRLGSGSLRVCSAGQTGHSVHQYQWNLLYHRGSVAKRENRIFVDESTSGTTGTVDSNETVLRVTQPDTRSGVTITASGFTNSSGSATTNYIQYRPSGALNSTATGTFTLCDERTGNFGRTVTVTATGRAVLATSSTASCS